MKQFALLIVVSVFLLLSACQNNSQGKVAEQNIFNLDSAKQSIEHQNIAIQKAFENSDSVGLGNLFTADAKMMMPGSPSVESRAAITSTVHSL